MNSSPLLVLLIVALYRGSSALSSWSYEGVNGPASWATNFPACGGSYQSPINIVGGFQSNGPRPVYTNYNEVPTTMTMANTGHTLKLSATYPAGKVPQLNIKTESGKTRTYTFDHLHFHWGKVDSEGSDHTFRGRKFAMEMHAVHFRVKDGVTVIPNQAVALGFLYKISSTDNPGIAKFLTKIADVKNPDTTIPLTPFAWSELIPAFTSNFYLYKGSLTIPPCPEIVNFFLRKTPMQVSSAQMVKFRTLLNSDNLDMSGNWRPVQKRNGRNVYYID